MNITNKEVIEKVASTIEKLSPLFGSAADLVEAVEEFGLFTGKAFCNNEGWGLDYTDVPDNPYAYAVQGWALPEFGAILDDNGNWHCSLGYGVHYLDLTFDKRGNVIEIAPDNYESERCWRTNDYNERIEIVKRYLNR